MVDREIIPPGQSTWRSDGNPTLFGPRSLGSRTQSLLISQGNKAPYYAKAQNGGDFFMKEFSVRYEPHRCNHFIAQYNTTARYNNDGDFFPSSPVLGSSDSRSWDAVRSLMVPMGAKGWNRFRPGKPIASLTQFLGELRELPKNPVRMASDMVRAMRRAGSKAAGADVLRRSVGDHYLNWSFGWRPFLDDLQKLADFNQNLGSYIRQLRRDNGQMIRRQGTISASSTTNTTESTGSVTAYMDSAYTANWNGFSKRTVTTQIKERFWFSAGFVYNLPHGNPDSDFNRLRQYLHGGGLSPSVVWELTPWSWLADYFGNVGDVLENWEAQRELNLAARYAYVMYRRDVAVLSEHFMYRSNPTYGELTQTGHVTSHTVTKARLGASAYGLGFTSGNLNNSQIANLVALGLSRRV